MAGSLAAAPLITTLASRPAWAACGMVSVMHSATHSPQAAQVTCVGQPPEYWRMNPDMVDQHVAEVGPPNPVNYSNLIGTPTDYSYPTDNELQAALGGENAVLRGENEEHHKALTQYRKWLRDYNFLDSPPFGTKFNDVFGSYTDGSLTIMQALWRDDLQLICQSACAWLNASEYAGGFGYTPGEVITHFQTTGMDDPPLLTAAFTAMNTASLTV
ncbi:MAG: hypothetical protein IID48_00145 [Proteobacteria bacterium]|nr:hypothetical protein [Pseudomonadota bacterium]